MDSFYDRCVTQIEQILAATDEPQRSQLRLLAETGMRVGELKWLTWDDTDFQNNVIHVQAKDDWQPKTGDVRAIPLSAKARDVLKQLPRDHRWVVTAQPSGKYPAGDRQISERRLLAYLKRLGLPGHLHTFRHAFISHALTSGVPEAIVRQWVGHVDRDVMQRYTHIADAASQAAMQRLASGDNSSKLQQKKESNDEKDAERKDAKSAQFQHKREAG